MKKILFVYFLLVSYVNVFCLEDPPKFGPRTQKGVLDNDSIDEASGLVSSYKNKGILWTHNDSHSSGGENRIFAIDSNGVSRGTYFINGVDNRDWEDIAVGPGPEEGVSYLYIGEIGDNDAQNEKKYVYRIVEPTVLINQSNSNNLVTEIDVISFTYPDGNRDAETLMIDPLTKDIFILGKRDSKARLYRLPFPQSTSSVFQAELSAKLTFPNDPEENTPENYLTGGEISVDGMNIIVKSYSNIYFWKRADGESITETMLNTPSITSYTIEPQGEAICWKNYNDNGYYTVSEENISFGGSLFEIPAVLYYYPREILTSIDNTEIIEQIRLEQNYPNPFNPNTSIKYSVPQIKSYKDQVIELKIYDLIGREVATLVKKKQKPGNYTVNFNGENLSSGVYYYSLKIDNYLKTKKMVILK